MQSADFFAIASGCSAAHALPVTPSPDADVSDDLAVTGPAASEAGGDPDSEHVAETGATTEAGADVAVACHDTLDDVYTTPADLPPTTANERGAVVRCAPDKTLSSADLAAALGQLGVSGVTPSTGVRAPPRSSCPTPRSAAPPSRATPILRRRRPSRSARYDPPLAALRSARS